MGEPLVGVRAAARVLEVSHSTVSRQIAAGIIPNHGTDAAPLVDVDEAREARRRGLDRSKQREPAKETVEGHSYQTARTRREEALASLAEITLQRELGRLLDRREVVDAFFTLGAR